MLFNNYESANTLEIKNNITRLGNYGQPQESFIYANIKEWLDDERRKMMLTAQDYFKVKNDIKDRKRYYIDRGGVKKEAQHLSNSKLIHPYFRKLTKQKINYLLSKKPSISCEDKAFAEILEEIILNDNFLMTLRNTGKDAIINGIGWIQIYYNEKGELKFKRIPSEEIIALWGDSDHTELEAIIRVYTIKHYNADGTITNKKKIEYYTKEGVWYYEEGKNGLIPDKDKGAFKGHFKVVGEVVNDLGEKETIEKEMVWEKIPFIAFKYNSDEVSLLELIKSMVDDYDINTSQASNNLQDLPDSIKVVKNYDGTDKEEFTKNLATFRTAFVSGDGGVDALEIKTDIATLDSHLNRLRKDIYEAASGVDTQEESLGTLSGVALKFRYSDLAADADEMGMEFSASINNLVWFIKIDLLTNGIGDYREVDFDLIYNTDTIMNESEVITSAKDSVGIISDATIRANHPWVTDAEAEEKQFEAEKKKKMEELKSMTDEDMGFGNDEGDDE